MFIRIIPVTRRGATSPAQTGLPELLRADLIQRVVPVTFGGMPCMRLTLDGGLVLECTGTLNDLIAVLQEPPEQSREPVYTPVPEPDRAQDVEELDELADG